MKAAVMTWHTYNNYGSLLQAYALQEAFQQNGVDSFLVDYDPLSYQRDEFSNAAGYIKHHARRMLKKHYAGRKGLIASRVYPQYEDEARNEAYDEFRKRYLHYTKKCTLASDFYRLNDDYDILACGSDQIWAPTSFNPRYYLDFAKDSKRTLAYAPSIGLPEIHDKAIRQQVADLTSRIAHLSIREERGAQILESLIGTKPEVVLDPTALHTGEEWLDLLPINPERNEDRPYAVCYFLSDDGQKWRSAQSIARSLGLKLLGIPVFKNDAKRGIELCGGVGPVEFLSIIAGANAVFTDSFHGTMFSLLFHKEPYIYKRFSDSSSTNQNSRINNILAISGLGDSVLQDAKSTNARAASPIDWSDVDGRIESVRRVSRAFLSESISSIADHNSRNKLASFPPTMTCCGCGACVATCPGGALSLNEDEKGFLQATINRERCVECGICIKMCPFSNSQTIDVSEAELYSYITSNKTALAKSASGGFSNDLAEEALARGYDVTGCVMSDDFRGAVHLTVSPDGGSPEAFQGSKYIQSDFTEAFRTLGCDNYQVVIGLPCQIAALRNAITYKKAEGRYLLVDLICHGVPSIHLYRRMLSEFLSHADSEDELCSVLFRDKKFGTWQDMCISLTGTDASYFAKADDDSFYGFFNQGHCYMGSCYECLWRKASAADIRIGDYWGSRFLDNTEGVSMVAVLTDKGASAMQQISQTRASCCERHGIADYLTVQQTKNKTKPVHRDALISDLKHSSLSLRELEKRWCPERKIQQSIRKAKARMPWVNNG